MKVLTRPAPKSAIAQRLRDAAADPMWADHAEVRKSTLEKAASEIERLIEELCYAQQEASNACAELSSSAVYGDAEHAVRDSKLAAAGLVRLQQHISAFFDDRTTT